MKHLEPYTYGTGSYGRLAGWQAGWLADEIQVEFEIFKIRYGLKY